MNSLLDPSCSGSGIVNRLDYLVDEGKASTFGLHKELRDLPASEETDVKTERLEKLASFQLQMILHAFKCTSPLCAQPILCTQLKIRSPSSPKDNLLDMLHPSRRR